MPSPQILFLTSFLFHSSHSWFFSPTPSTLPTFKNGSPVILVPGDGGSQIQAKLNKSTSVHYVCEKTTKDYFDLWLNLELLVPVVLGCFVDNMRLVYNVTEHRSQNSPGVETRIPGFGNTTTVEWLDSSQNKAGRYYADIGNAAVGWGYRRGKNLRGAPFDFRKAPSEAEEYLKNLKGLIEETYYANGNKKVVMVAHSMGNPYLLYFFNRQPQVWKDKFIRAHVAISPPWAGSMKIVKMLASGYNLDHWRILISPITLREEQRSMTSTTFLMPSDQFWSPNETMVVTPARNYTVSDYHQFFKDINFETPGWAMYQDTGRLIRDLVPPGVEVHCLYGVGVPTPEMFTYSSNLPNDNQPSEKTGDGDGTVNLRSLEACLRWRGKQKQAIYVQTFKGQDHMSVLAHPPLIAYLKRLLFS